MKRLTPAEVAELIDQHYRDQYFPPLIRKTKPIAMSPETYAPPTPKKPAAQILLESCIQNLQREEPIAALEVKQSRMDLEDVQSRIRYREAKLQEIREQILEAEQFILSQGWTLTTPEEKQARMDAEMAKIFGDQEETPRKPLFTDEEKLDMLFGNV